MKKLFILACMLVLFVCGAHAQQGKQAFGFHLGYGTEIESVGIGVKYQYNILDALRLEPSVDYFFKNDGVDMFDFNVNAHYLFPVASGARLNPLYKSKETLKLSPHTKVTTECKIYIKEYTATYLAIFENDKGETIEMSGKWKGAFNKGSKVTYILKDIK